MRSQQTAIADFNKCAPLRQKALKAAFARIKNEYVPVTAFGLLAATGEGVLVNVAYFLADSLDQAQQKLVERFGQYGASHCELVYGFVTQTNLADNPDAPEFAGLVDVWPFYESMISPYLIDNINKGGHGNLDLWLSFHANYS